MLKNYNIIKKSLIVLSIAVGFSSCNKDEFFELPDRGGIDGQIYSIEGALEMHLNRAYDVIIPPFLYENFIAANMQGRYGIHYANDESFFPTNDEWARKALGLEVPEISAADVRFTGNTTNGNVGGNKYMDISRCNNAIKFIPEGTLPQTTKDKFLGQYYTLRAMVYFELVKVYGGVPLVLEPQDPENINISGRASARECFNVIIRDLDSGIVKLKNVTWSDATGRGRIDALTAACLKAKVLLYWASPQFNPKDDPRHPYDANRWNTALEANKMAYEMAVAAGKRLIPKYEDIFRTEGAGQTEAILVRTYSSAVDRRGQDVEYKSRPSSENNGAAPYAGFRPTKKLVEAYPMRDGNPALVKDNNGTVLSTHPDYDPVVFWKNRDPRFEATIAYNGSVWPLSGKTNRRQWSYTAAADETNIVGLYCKRFTMPTLPVASVRYTNNLGGNGMDWIELRLAEVMLNYADCENEAPNGTIEKAKNMVREIRARAGIVAGSNDYGLGAVGKDALRDLILNERMIEFAFENKRNADLRRTRTMHKLSGRMESIEFVPKDAAAKTALEAGTPRLRESLDLNNKTIYLQYFKEPSTSFVPAYNNYSVPEFHYFYTFHNDFIYRGNNIPTTIGWPGGTFDPLDN